MNRFMPIFFLTATLGSSALAIEEPKYEVIEKFETFEIRRYDP
ncbi:MAG: heme-binding protein, partial [Candidatus Omnitrophica bacterium]|nr:heme-binding protein [Candidatus Omnitrophota bacterium]